MTGKEALKRLEKQYKRQNEYIKNTYDRCTITLPKGTKDKIKSYGETANGIINKLLLEWLDRQEQQQKLPEDPQPISTGTEADNMQLFFNIPIDDDPGKSPFS